MLENMLFYFWLKYVTTLLGIKLINYNNFCNSNLINNMLFDTYAKENTLEIINRMLLSVI